MIGVYIKAAGAIIVLAVFILSAIIRAVVRASKSQQRSYYPQNGYTENKGTARYSAYPLGFSYHSRCSESEIYIGKEAGSALKECLASACNSVDVVSPYTSHATVEELIKLSQKGVKVRLITNDDLGWKKYYTNSAGEKVYKEQYKSNVGEIFRKHTHENIQELQRKKSLEQTKEMLVWLNFSVFLVGVVVAFFVQTWWVLAALIPIFILLIVIQDKADEIRNVQVYTYTYSTLFPIKIFQDYSKDTPSYIHSKVYVIDEKVAFLGSFNFTQPGIYSNYETRIKITDSGAVKEIKRYVDDLFNQDQRAFGLEDITGAVQKEWKEVCSYSEPPN